ncbi:hypothetical protein N0V82_005455 [Gnomoniopsis sp. IMI 355080]|nr:hypothetical protein N0V82_005455 [Gnomoniopsis sp. IMI 355080]
MAYFPPGLVHHDLDQSSAEMVLDTDCSISPAGLQVIVPSLSTLPVEVVQDVLGFLPDVDSVANASMSCRRWYAAFRAIETHLLEKALCRELGNLSDLHPGAIVALRIPLNQDNARDLNDLLSFMPIPTGPTPHKARDVIVKHARAAAAIHTMAGVVRAQPEADFDPIKGPFTIKRARDMVQVHKAHRRLTEMFLVPFLMGAKAIERSPGSPDFETALWHFETFCRLFGGQLWYWRWRSSICFVWIIEAFWECHTRDEADGISEVHSFLTALVIRDITSVIQAPCIWLKAPYPRDWSECSPI